MLIELSANWSGEEKPSDSLEFSHKNVNVTKTNSVPTRNVCEGAELKSLVCSSCS